MTERRDIHKSSIVNIQFPLVRLDFSIFIYVILIVSGPEGRRPRFGPVTIEKVIHQRKEAAGPFVAHHQRYYDSVGECARMTPGTHPHTDVAVGADLAPVAEAGLCIQLPSQNTIGLLLITIGNRTGRTAARAFFAKTAKIFDTDIHRMIDNQGHIGRYGKEPDPWAQFFGDQVSKTARFTQTGVYGGGYQ